MKNNRGQALVEFIMILPILILFIMAVFDFANILLKKNEMNDILNDVVSLYENNKKDKIQSFVTENGVEFFIDEKDGFLTITISKKIDINTPGLSNILGNPYKIEESRTIYKNE